MTSDLERVRQHTVRPGVVEAVVIDADPSTGVIETELMTTGEEKTHRLGVPDSWDNSHQLVKLLDDMGYEPDKMRRMEGDLVHVKLDNYSSELFAPFESDPTVPRIQRALGRLSPFQALEFAVSVGVFIGYAISFANVFILSSVLGLAIVVFMMSIVVMLPEEQKSS